MCLLKRDVLTDTMTNDPNNCVPFDCFQQIIERVGNHKFVLLVSFLPGYFSCCQPQAMSHVYSLFGTSVFLCA